MNIKILKIIGFTVVLFLITAVFISCGKKSETTDNRESKQTQDNNIQTSTDKNAEHVEIKLPSMQCSTCKKNIEKAVNKVPGVMSIKVDKDEKVAHVNFDKSKTDFSKIETAITMAGYDANDKKADPTAYENLDDCCKLPKDQKEKSGH